MVCFGKGLPAFAARIAEGKLLGKGRIAILVCDGLRQEIAETIYQQAKSKKSNDYAFAMLPSVTETA